MDKDITEEIKRKRTTLIIITTLSVILSGISGYLLLKGFPYMHIIAYIVFGCSFLVVTYLGIGLLGAYNKHVKLARFLKRCYLICFAIGLVCFIILQGLIISGARTDAEQVDCIIILGAGLRNSAPSLILRQRLDAAIGYLNEHGDIPVIVTGGLGQGESITEAEAKLRYLTARGVNEALIFKEEASTNTRENIKFAIAVMEENGFDITNTKVAVVTNEFHLYRAKLIAERAGLENVVGIAAKTRYIHFLLLYSFREAFSLASEFIRG